MLQDFLAAVDKLDYAMRKKNQADATKALEATKQSLDAGGLLVGWMFTTRGEQSKPLPGCCDGQGGSEVAPLLRRRCRCMELGDVSCAGVGPPASRRAARCPHVGSPPPPALPSRRLPPARPPRAVLAKLA